MRKMMFKASMNPEVLLEILCNYSVTLPKKRQKPIYKTRKIWYNEEKEKEVTLMPTYEELLEIIAKQQELIKKLTAELEKANQRIAELENEVARLKKQLNKNGHSSSKPPSSEGYEKPSPKSQRRSSGRKAGRQKGHKGHHIALGNPDRVETIYPAKCVNCPHKNNCENLKVHDSCYVVDVIVKKRSRQISDDGVRLRQCL